MCFGSMIDRPPRDCHNVDGVRWRNWDRLLRCT